MKTKRESVRERKGLHQGYEGQNEDDFHEKCRSSGGMKDKTREIFMRNVVHLGYEGQNFDNPPENVLH